MDLGPGRGRRSRCCCCCSPTGGRRRGAGDPSRGWRSRPARACSSPRPWSRVRCKTSRAWSNPLGVDGLDALAVAGRRAAAGGDARRARVAGGPLPACGALERRQLGWFAYAAALIALPLLAAAVLGALGVPETVTSYLNVLPLAALPLAVGAALARHRLYDLDTLVDRTLLATALAGFVTLVYVVVVVVAGNLVGGSSVLLATVATALGRGRHPPAAARGCVRRTARLAYREPEPQVEAARRSRRSEASASSARASRSRRGRRRRRGRC